MSSFVGVIQAAISRIGPYFLHGNNIGTFLEAVAHSYDEGVESLKQGLYQSQPFKCDSASLPIIAIDRVIRLYPSESEESKRFRLSQWHQLHRGRGTHVGELKHAQPYFLPDAPVIRIVHQDGAGATATWHTIDQDGVYTISRATPSNWNYDGRTTHWSRWWVIIYIPARYVNLSFWDDGGTWDSDEVYDGITTQVAQDITNLFQEWHSAHSRLGAVILTTDPAAFDPSATAVTDPAGWTSLPVGNWGAPISPPPVSVYTRPPTALWIYEGVP